MATTLPPGSSDAERFLDERLEQQLVEAGLTAQATRRESDAKFECLRAEMNARFAETYAKFDAQRRETRALFGVLITLVVALIVIVATRGA